MIENIFLLGNHIQALGVARLAGKINLKVTLFNSYKLGVTRFSKHCNHFILFRDHENLLDLILDQYREKRNILLIPTNDNLVEFLHDNFKLLNEKFYLSIPIPEITEKCHNKRLTYQKAKELNIPIPESYFPNSLDELITLSKKITYPVIIKPATMYDFHKATGKKVYKCDDENELILNYKNILKIISAEEVIVQEFLSGGAKTLFSYGSFSVNGEIQGGFSANRIRQKPMDFGISTCYAKTVDNDQIFESAKKFLKGINYFGFSEVEFMYDSSTKKYKLLEINPRFWKWHSIANKLEINLLEMMVRFFNNEPITKKISREKDIVWVERVTDFYVVINEILKGSLTIKEYFQSLNYKKEFAAWSFKDPMPGIMYLILTPYLIFKR